MSVNKDFKPILNGDTYYKNNKFLKLLRFFNLLEPDRNVLSLSKIMVWLSLIMMIFVMMDLSQNTAAILGALSAMVVTMLNYGYRRYVQHEQIKNGNIPESKKVDNPD